VCCINSQKANYRCSTREDKIINITNSNQIIRNYMAVEKVNTQMQLVTEYINIFGEIIQLNYINLVKRRRNMQNKHKILNQGIYITECN
jgi:hypothetical protein